MNRPRVVVVSWLTVVLALAVLFAGCGLLRVVVAFVSKAAGGG